MHVNKHVRTCEGVRVSESAPQGWRERVRKNSVDRKHEGTQKGGEAWASVGARLHRQVAEGVGSGQVGVGPGDERR